MNGLVGIGLFFVTATVLGRLVLTSEKKAMAQRLAQYCDPRTVGHLIGFLAWPDAQVRANAVRALAQVQAHALAPLGVHVATVTVRGFVGEDQQIHPDRIAGIYAELVAETAGPRDGWRTVLDVHP